MPQPRFAVALTQGAEDDLEEIHAYLAEQRSPDDADALLDECLSVIESLESFPARGAVPKELDALGIRDFRQVLMRQYRLIYRVIDHTVFILLIADGRRDMQALLERRVLGR
ncbi:MAG: type II toxin-antitoxin system RelE/ParE family toxin [Alphaproteobacteria bacterium]|nr:type II toxin-antitoxin system RelE/ParE family toxin [Alphaproteobacteria bacterium]MBU0794492.1 type II toxin-antitoxin system RelE/ParE family toxin [Alphaproteobacteria bacterium]MBU0876058.1 type II toxin-antitoxin system RelE/ParE family toxin [Alphaproteobacteria bacterium]MBU1770666.1 type II toxin-antitoxin system RelE/ParE family toxin [Alphaproteobacteria bacterium]